MKKIIQKIINKFRREPDRHIGGKENPYMRRWHIIPRNKWFNIYLHHFLRDDDDRALHDHPWHSLSIMLAGSYLEHLPGGVIRTVNAGSVKFRKATHMHRIQLFKERTYEHSTVFFREVPRPVWTIFITGRKIREWGYDCPQGWKHNTAFNNPTDGDLIGKGCAD